MHFRPVAGALLTLAVGAGMAFTWIGDGPRSYLAINGAALALAIMAIAFVPPPSRPLSSMIWAALVAALLWIPVLAGPALDGIQRWIAAGPVRLHSGMLAIPILCALLPQLGDRMRVVLAGLAAAALALQPDRASALALLAGTAAIAIGDRRRANLVACGVALAALIATMLAPDTLAPVAFVENVVQDAWRSGAGPGAILSLALAAAFVGPAMADRSFVPVAAAFAGFSVASLIGPYPTPLIGAGASAILGFGFAVALLPVRVRECAK